MDYYQVLKVPPNAKQVDLDRAYQKMIKESRYDHTINRKDVELAYRTLSDGTQRALYDATLAMHSKRTVQAEKERTRALKKVTHTKWLHILFVVLVIAWIAYYSVRFGYLLKNFEAGDKLYDKYTHRYFGVVEKVDDNHSFGKVKVNAYLVKFENGEELWFPATDIKSTCVKK